MDALQVIEAGLTTRKHRLVRHHDDAVLRVVECTHRFSGMRKKFEIRGPAHIVAKHIEGSVPVQEHSLLQVLPASALDHA
ncbi:hypothetical protein D3C72_2118730 [compost metagenome]